VERSELRCWPQRYVALTQPVIEPLGESCSDTSIIIGLANKLGLDDALLNPFGTTTPSAVDRPGRGFLPDGRPDFSHTFDDIMDWIIEPSGITTEQLKEHPGGMPVPHPTPPTYKKYEQNGFPTPSGKMEFASSLLEKHSQMAGIDALPLYREPELSPTASPDVMEEYPFILGTGSRLPMFIHSRTFRLPWTRSLRPDAACDINPADAIRLGIAQGDRVELRTPYGSIEVRANVTELAYPGAVHMFHDYPEANVNTLLAGDYLDPISGFPGFKSSLCAVHKITRPNGEAQGEQS
jgi:anaerobic selenocysteine-containing dehydrogenase